MFTTALTVALWLRDHGGSLSVLTSSITAMPAQYTSTAIAGPLYWRGLRRQSQAPPAR